MPVVVDNQWCKNGTKSSIYSVPCLVVKGIRLAREFENGLFWGVSANVLSLASVFKMISPKHSQKPLQKLWGLFQVEFRDVSSLGQMNHFIVLSLMRPGRENGNLCFAVGANTHTNTNTHTRTYIHTPVSPILVHSLSFFLCLIFILSVLSSCLPRSLLLCNGQLKTKHANVLSTRYSNMIKRLQEQRRKEVGKPTIAKFHALVFLANLHHHWQNCKRDCQD